MSELVSFFRYLRAKTPYENNKFDMKNKSLVSLDIKSL